MRALGERLFLSDKNISCYFQRTLTMGFLPSDYSNLNGERDEMGVNNQTNATMITFNLKSLMLIIKVG